MARVGSACDVFGSHLFLLSCARCQEEAPNDILRLPEHLGRYRRLLSALESSKGRRHSTAEKNPTGSRVPQPLAPVQLWSTLKDVSPCPRGHSAPARG